MRAVVVNEYGGTPALAEVPTPQPGAGQVLIKLRAAGMNPMDRTLASGDWRPMPATFPMVLGADGAGVVDRVGASDGRDGRALPGGAARAAHRQDRVDRRGGGWCRHLCHSVRCQGGRAG